MIILWVFGLIMLAAVIYLNITGTQIIQSSQIHTARKKRNLILVVWLAPVAGIFAALYLINRDIKRNQAKIEKDIAPAIRDLTDKIKNLEAGLKQEEKKQKYH
jgi:TRAP-type C4-dicarboxylate transport system permease small subunit